MDKSELGELLAKAFTDAPQLPPAGPGLQLSFAMLRVLARRYGQSFVDEVRVEIEDKADRMDASANANDRANAGEIRSLMDN